MKISIIIPVYNAYQSLSKCLDSVVNQTYKNIEIILMNDGSKDNSILILNEYAKNYSNIIVIDKINEGVSITRNKGIQIATGDYIMFIDNDDYIDKDYVEKYVLELEKNNYDIVIGGYRRTTESKTLFSYKLKETEWSKYVILSPWAKIYKKEFLIQNKIEFLNYKIGEDVYFNLKAYSYNPLIKVIEYIGYNWFYNEKSVSNTDQKGLNNEVNILNLLEKLLEFIDLKDDYMCYFIRRYIIWYLLFSGRKASKKSFLREYKKVRDFIKTKNIKSNITPLSSKLEGETLKNRIIVLVFKTIERFHLINLFASIYCRGSE